MPLHITSVILVGMPPEAAALARATAREVFPGATVAEAASFEAARDRAGAPGSELLLLGEQAAAHSAHALADLDARGLPRWPVVIFGPQPPGAHVLPPEEWNPRAAARIFQAAVSAHGLTRENARLRGDLFTVGRRLSHDLRTPLMGVSTACDAIMDTLPDAAAAREGFAKSITTSAEEVAGLLDRISGLLKATAETKAMEAVPMGNAVWAALQRLDRRRMAQGAVILQPAEWPTVPGNATWLELIWGNLVGNALDHAGKEPRIELGWGEVDGGWRFWIQDGGPGVPARVVASLFHPFDLLHRPNAPRGWGLPIVQRLVELQDGTCGYEALPGGGARFFFTLPA
jgi:signal transduction histidine kinase